MEHGDVASKNIPLAIGGGIWDNTRRFAEVGEMLKLWCSGSTVKLESRKESLAASAVAMSLAAKQVV